MDDDDLAAFGLAEVDEDRAAGEWDDARQWFGPVDADGHPALTPEQVGQMAVSLMGADDLQGSCLVDLLDAWRGAGYAESCVFAWVARAAPVVAKAEAQADAAVADAIAGRDGDTRHPEYDAWLATTDATEAAVRAMRAAGGGA